MAAIRMLAGGAWSFATPGTIGMDGAPEFEIGAGGTDRLTLDYSGYLGGETIVGSNFTADGLTLSASASAGKQAFALVTAPESFSGGSVTHRMSNSGGRAIVTTMRFRSRAR